MPRHRLGVVLLLEAAVSAEVDGLRRALGSPDLDRIAPHVTLVPPINVRDEHLGEAFAVVRSAVRAVPPVSLGPVTSFQPVSPTLHLAVADEGAALASLRQAVATGPFEREPKHPFVPHVTLMAEAPEQRLSAAVTALGSYRRAAELIELAILRQGEDRTWRRLAAWRTADPGRVGTGGLAWTFLWPTVPDPQVAEFLPEDLDVEDVVTAHPGDASSEPVGVAWGRAGSVEVRVQPDYTDLGLEDHLRLRIGRQY